MTEARMLLLLSCVSALTAETGFRVENGRVQALAGGEVVAASPAEGLWAVACDWQQGWPAAWRHAAPARVLREGEWTILRGELSACGGVWALEDAYRPENGLVRGVRRWTWKGARPASRVTLQVRFDARSDSARVLLPGILYYGNPSGARSGRVPEASAESLFEEHRYPMPFASVELRRGERMWGVALHTVPSPAPYGHLRDQWWSLGTIAAPGATALVALSGPCASNGQRSAIKGVQRGFVPYENAWLEVEPGAVIEKSFYLQAYPVAREGSGFQPPVRASIALFRPFYAEDLPAFADILRAKYRYAKTRWREAGGYAVFQKYAGRPFGVMGWTGQAEAPGYALQALAQGLGEPQAPALAQKSLDFLSTAPFYDGGFHNWFDLEKREWSGRELLNQGQAMLAFARAIRVGRGAGRDTSKWESFLRRAAGVHAARILAASWSPVSTGEAAFVAPLLQSAGLFGEERYRQAAVKAAVHYARRHLSMREPYWGGTLDARSEDKEGAALAFQAFLELYETTRDGEHLDWARHACDVMLTYTYVWDAPLPAGRLSDHRLRTRGWTAVSPQNQHLDVWGALTAPEVYRLGAIDGREDLKKLAIVMYRSAGQLIDPYGSQGEQLQQTNYAQRGADVPLAAMRGGYHEQWTVFWITAHFLTGGARFLELGVPVWQQ